MSANHRGLINRWMKSIFAGNSKESESKKSTKRLALEALETRENPAFNLTIGGGVLAGVTQASNAGTLTLTANATGANIPVDIITNFLAQANNTVVTISNGATGAEAGNITWSSNPLDCAGNPNGPIGLINTLNINFDPSTTTGQLNIADNMIVGDSFNALKLNIDTSLASSTPGGFTPQLQLGAIDTGVIDLRTKASTVTQLDRVSAQGSINLSSSSFTLFNQLFAGSSTLNPGNITIGSSLGAPGINIEAGGGASSYNFQATGTINITGNMRSSTNVPVRFQSNTGTVVSGQIGDPQILRPLGPITLAGPGPINISGRITADSLVVDPTNPNFNLTLSGGANLLNQIDTSPTSLNNNGTLSIGASPTDYYLFGSGFQSNSLSTPINILGTIASPAVPISIGNLVLNGNSGIDSTNKNSSPLGANITLGSAKGSIIGTGSTPTVTLTMNSGTTGNISVVPVMQKIAQVVINNANQVNFSAATTLNNLVVNKLTAGNSVAFDSTANISTLNLTNLGANSSVTFNKAATVGQITSAKAANYGVQFNANGSITGALSGNVNLIKSGSGNTTLNVSGATATGTYTGGLVVNNGNLSVNTNFSASPVTINGGALTGTGPVGIVTTPGANPKSIRPGNPIGNLRLNTLNLGASSQLAIGLQSATPSLNGRVTSTGAVSLTGGSLDVNLANGFFPANGSSFTIVNNTSALPTTGTFFGLPEGGLITVGGATFAITYAGGDGNEIVLTTVKTGSGNQGYVRYLYSSILNRAPDEVGLAVFSTALDRGASREAVTTALWKSAEHRSLQVQSYYNTFLGRAADPSGLAFYVGQFQAGATEELVMTYFLTSGEYQVANPPVNSYITALFNDLLGRNPSVAELNQWRGVMYSGVPRSQVALSFLFSNEYLAKTVNGFYNSYLGRQAGPSGINYWVSVAQANRSQGLVAISILSSTEAYNSAVAGP